MNVIEFNHVWKKFRKGEKFNSLRDAIPNLFRKRNSLESEEFWALHDVSFAIKKNEVVGIIGPNGAGKSTILKLLSRIMKPSKGEIRINGKLSALIEVGAGFHNELTGRENIYLNGTILGMTKKEIDSKFDQIVDFSGLAEFIDTPVKRYSSGMYARLGFSVAAHMDPDILLVDEVLAVGDMAFQTKCAEKMRELLNSNTTIVLISHSLSLIQSLCKRVIFLDKGKIQNEGEPEEIIPYYQNTVLKQQEENLRKRIGSEYEKVKVERDTPITITDVSMHNDKAIRRNEFKVDEPIYISIEYEAKKEIDTPIFLLEIIRSDGVLCCSSNTKNSSAISQITKGKSLLRVDLSRVHLFSGIYVIRISIWDKEMIHPYTPRKKEIFMVTAQPTSSIVGGIFIPNINWSKESNAEMIIEKIREE